MKLQPGKAIDELNSSYSFRGRSYSSLKELFLVFFSKKNYRHAVEEWSSGKFPVWLTQNTNDVGLVSKVKELLSIEKLGLPDQPMVKAKVQLGVLALYVNPEQGFVIDNQKIDQDSFTKKLKYFIYQKDENSPKQIAATANLIGEAIGTTQYADRLESSAKILAKYSDVVKDYKFLFNLSDEEEYSLLINFDEDDFKKVSWSVETFKELAHLAGTYSLIPDNAKVSEIIKRYQSKASLDGIKSLGEKFKKRYSRAINGWREIFHKKSPSNLEYLLLLSTPDQYLFKRRGVQHIKIAIAFFLLMIGLIGLLMIPFLFLEDESAVGRSSEYVQQLGGNGNDEFVDFEIIGNQGNFLIAGHTTSFGAGDSSFWLVKLDADGNTEWSKTVDNNSDEFLTAFAIAPDGFVLAGNVEKPNATSVILVKLDGNATYQWNIGFTAGKTTVVKDLAVVSFGPRQGQIIVAGDYFDNQGVKSIFLISLDQKGRVLWRRTIVNEIQAESVGMVIGKNNDVLLFVNIPGQGISKDLLFMSYSLDGRVLSEILYSNFELNSPRLIQAEENNIILAGKNIDLATGKTHVDIINLNYEGIHLWDRRIIEEDNIAPKSITPITISGSDNKSYLLVADAGEINSGKRILVREIAVNGVISSIWIPEHALQREPLFGLVSQDHVVLGGINFFNDIRKQDIWIIRYPIKDPRMGSTEN